MPKFPQLGLKPQGQNCSALLRLGQGASDICGHESPWCLLSGWDPGQEGW